MCFFNASKKVILAPPPQKKKKRSVLNAFFPSKKLKKCEKVNGITLRFARERFTIRM